MGSHSLLFVRRVMFCSLNRDKTSVELVTRFISMPQAFITAIRRGTDNYAVSKKRATINVVSNVIHCFVANLKDFSAVKEF